jgi:hypothetical protein
VSTTRAACLPNLNGQPRRRTSRPLTCATFVSANSSSKHTLSSTYRATVCASSYQTVASCSPVGASYAVCDARAPTGVTTLFNGQRLEPKRTPSGLWCSLFDGRISGSPPEGKALLNALFTLAADARDEDTPAAKLGMVHSCVSFLFRGEKQAVPVIIPPEQADGNGDLVGGPY